MLTPEATWHAEPHLLAYFLCFIELHETSFSFLVAVRFS